MYWRKWFKNHWWIVLFPITVPAGIIILRHINKISEIKEIIKNEKLKEPLPDVKLIPNQNGDIVLMNRCFDCGRSDSSLLWLLTELGGKKFCCDCYKVYYRLIDFTNNIIPETPYTHK